LRCRTASPTITDRSIASEDIVKTEIYESDPFTPKGAFWPPCHRIPLKGGEMFFDDARAPQVRHRNPDAHQSQQHPPRYSP
jgi:hypothetical protein